MTLTPLWAWYGCCGIANAQTRRQQPRQSLAAAWRDSRDKWRRRAAGDIRWRAGCAIPASSPRTGTPHSPAAAPLPSPPSLSDLISAPAAHAYALAGSSHLAIYPTRLASRIYARHAALTARRANAFCACCGTLATLTTARVRALFFFFFFSMGRREASMQ